MYSYISVHSLMDEKLTLLARLLSQRGDTILNGKAKLSLQLDELLHINKLFDFSGADEDFVAVPSLNSPQINTILDFLQKTKAIKLSGSNLCDIFSLKICKSLKYLELYSVPVEVLTDVAFLKSKIRTIALNRSCSDLCGFLSSEDSSTVWKHLTRANFCFNNIHIFSAPFKDLTPYIRYLDLSHNDIRQLGDVLLGLKHLQTLKISFNLLEDIPLVDASTFVTLIARNNNIKMLDGFYQIKSMVDIDLRGNCLEYIEQLSPLAHFSKLEHLYLSENPIQFNSKYRTGVLKELNHQINADKFYLDSSKVTLREYEYLRAATSASITAAVFDNEIKSSPVKSQAQETPLSSFNSKSSIDSPMLDRSSPRKLQRVKVVTLGDEIDDTSGEVSEQTSTSEAEVADSMVERYGDNWLAFFEGKESDKIITDDNIGLDQLTAGLAPEEESSSESEEEIEEAAEETRPTEHQPEEKPDAAELVLEVDSPDVRHEMESPFSNGTTEDNVGDIVNDAVNLSETIEDLMGGDEEDHLLETTKGTQHLVKLKDEDVFLLVHETIITEQDSIGQNLDRLDIRCLENFIENATDKSVELQFDHVSPTRKRRMYFFETVEEMYVFLKEIQDIWMTVREENSPLTDLQCLNCQAIFPKNDKKCCNECFSEHLIPYTPFEVLPGTGKYLNDSGALPRLEEPNKSDVEDNDSVGTIGTTVTVKSVSSNYSTATTHTDYTSYSTNKLFINQTNFVKADHQLELFFDVELFMRTSEVLCCYLFAQYAKYGRTRTIDCVLVVSNYMVYMCKLRPNDKPSLKSRHRLSQLKYLDIGLNSQHFRLEWESKEAAYKILVYDKEKCSKFMESFTLALPQTTQVTKVSDSTISDIQELVFGIDKTFELFAKGKMYRQIMKTSTDSRWGIKDRMLMFRTYESCFPGTELVDMMLEEGDYKSRAEAVEMCHQLLVVDVLHHVKLEEQFRDDSTLYRSECLLV